MQALRMVRRRSIIHRSPIFFSNRGLDSIDTLNAIAVTGDRSSKLTFLWDVRSLRTSPNVTYRLTLPSLVILRNKYTDEFFDISASRVRTNVEEILNHRLATRGSFQAQILLHR